MDWSGGLDRLWLALSTLWVLGIGLLGIGAIMSLGREVVTGVMIAVAVPPIIGLCLVWALKGFERSKTDRPRT